MPVGQLEATALYCPKPEMSRKQTVSVLCSSYSVSICICLIVLLTAWEKAALTPISQMRKSGALVSEVVG